MSYPDYGKAATHIVKGIGGGTGQGDPFEQAVIAAGGVNIDHSGAGAWPPDGTFVSLKTIVANPNRRGYLIQNQCKDDLWLKFTADGTGTPSWFKAESGGADYAQGGSYDWSRFPHTGQIEIFGKAGTVLYAAAEL